MNESRKTIIDKLKYFIKKREDEKSLDFWIIANEAGVSIHKGIMGDGWLFNNSHPHCSYDFSGGDLEELIDKAYKKELEQEK